MSLGNKKEAPLLSLCALLHNSWETKEQTRGIFLLEGNFFSPAPTVRWQIEFEIAQILLWPQILVLHSRGD